MEFFGRTVSSLFDRFYESHVAVHMGSVEVSFQEIPDDAASIRGEGPLEFGYTVQDRDLPGNAEVHIRTSLPAADFEHCLAHELLHVVSGVVRFPAPAINRPDDSPEAGIVRDLFTIECAANDRLLVSLGFDSYIFSIRLQRLMQRITETSGANDDLSRPWAVRTTIHYLRALIDSGPEALAEVRVGLEMLPSIRERGDQMYSVIAHRDLQDHGQRLLALMLIRDTLNLTGKVAIVEPGEPDRIH